MSKKYELTTSKSLSTTGNSAKSLTVYFSDFNNSISIPSNEYVSFVNLSHYLKCYRTSVLITNGGAQTEIYKTSGSNYEIANTWGNQSSSDYSYNIINYLDEQYKFHRIRFYFFSTTLNGINKQVSNIKLSYYTLPYNLIIKNVTGGTVIKGHVDITETAIHLMARPSTGYKFVSWSDGSTNINYTFDPGETAIGKTIEIYPIFEPITYYVNYYVQKDANTIELLFQQECLYDQTYTYLPKPEGIFNNIPKGYKENSIGWTEYWNKDYHIINKTNQVYNETLGYSIIQYKYGSDFLNLKTEEGEIEKRYYGILQIAYSVTYNSYIKGNYDSSTTEHRKYGVDYSLKISSRQNGYKCTNRMNVEDGPEIKEKNNAWFISVNNLNPGDPVITSIDPLLEEDVEVYSNQVPIDYTIVFHGMDENGKELSSFELKTKYGISTNKRPEILEEKEYYKISGWYNYSRTPSNWYIDSNTLTSINVPTLDYNRSSSISSSYTSIDQSIYHEYIYYIPYGYFVNYYWLDDWGINEEKFQLKTNVVRRYGTQYSIEHIPGYSEYNVENAWTKKWYYYDELNNLLQNENDYIDAYDITPIYNFYARKEPVPRKIKIISNNSFYGDVLPPNLSDWFYEDGGYYTYANEKDTLSFSANLPKGDFAIFDQWSDGTGSRYKTITVGGTDQTYIAIYRSNKIFIGTKGIQGFYKGTQLVNPEVVQGVPAQIH